MFTVKQEDNIGGVQRKKYFELINKFLKIDIV